MRCKNCGRMMAHALTTVATPKAGATALYECYGCHTVYGGLREQYNGMPVMYWAGGSVKSEALPKVESVPLNMPMWGQVGWTGQPHGKRVHFSGPYMVYPTIHKEVRE